MIIYILVIIVVGLAVLVILFTSKNGRLTVENNQLK